MANQGSQKRPRTTGADPQGTRDARDDATIIEWLTRIDQDIVSGLKTIDTGIKDIELEPEEDEKFGERPLTLSQLVHVLKPAIAVPPLPPQPATTTEETEETKSGAIASAIRTAIAPLAAVIGSLKGLFGKKEEHGAGETAAASGGTFVTSGPTRMLVGEAGPEKVDVTPLTSGPKNREGGGHGELHMQAGGTILAGAVGRLAGQAVGAAAGAIGGAIGGPVVGEAVNLVVNGFIRAASSVVTFAEDMSKANQALAEFSPSMAAIFAQSHLRDVQRQIGMGEATAGTASNLQDSLNDLKDTLAPIGVVLRNLANTVLATLMRALTFLLKPLEVLANFANWWMGNKMDEDKGNTVGAWLDGIANEWEQRNPQRPFGRPAWGTSGGDF
jgi:hypothetical protein